MLPCKLSTYAVADGTYPRVKIAGKSYQQSRLVYCAHHKLAIEALAGLVIMHTCDTPACIEPTHLVLATQATNIQDMWAKSRQGVVGMQGVKHPMSKLTAEDVLAIRADTRTSNKILAIRFGVSTASVSLIRAGKTWRHLLTSKRLEDQTP